jgi:hypothetical protein
VAMPRRRVAYFYESSVGNFYFGRGTYCQPSALSHHATTLSPSETFSGVSGGLDGMWAGGLWRF